MGFNFASYWHPAYFDHKCLPDKIKSNHSFKNGRRDALKPRIFSTTLNHPPPPKSCLDLKLIFSQSAERVMLIRSGATALFLIVAVLFFHHLLYRFIRTFIRCLPANWSIWGQLYPLEGTSRRVERLHWQERASSPLACLRFKPGPVFCPSPSGTSNQPCVFLDALASLDPTQVAWAVRRWVINSNSEQ